MCSKNIYSSPPVIYFKQNSTEYLDSTVEKRMQDYFLLLRKLDATSLEIEIRFHLCPDERKKNYLLGYQRAEKVIRYARGITNIDKRFFFIEDVSENFVWNGKCEHSGIVIAPSYR